MRRRWLKVLLLGLAALAIYGAFALRPLFRAEPAKPHDAIVVEKKESQSSAEADDQLLRDGPLTIVFRRLHEHTAGPWRWSWSINSAGDAELTISSFNEPVRRKMALTPEQLSAIRQSLRDERFLDFKDKYGSRVVHGGWDTLTVIAGEHINKTVRYNSIWFWTRDWYDKEAVAEASAAVRVWLTIVEIVDPDGEIFDDRKKLAAMIEAVKKP